MFHVVSVQHHIRGYGDGWRSLFVCEDCRLVTCNGTGWNWTCYLNQVKTCVAGGTMGLCGT